MLKTELVETAIYPYFKPEAALENLIFADAMAAHALLKALDKLITTDPSLKKRIISDAKATLKAWRV